MTIKRKFGAYMAVVLVALGIVGIATGRAVRANQRTQAVRSVDAVARLESRRVEDWLTGTSRELTSPAIAAVLVPALDAHRASPTPEAGAAVGAALADVVPFVGVLRAATIVDLDGTAIADTTASHPPQHLDQDFVRAAIDHINVGAPYVVGTAVRIAPGDERYVNVVPIRRGSTTVGYLVAECDLATVQSLVSRASVLGDSAEANLVQMFNGGAQYITDLRFAPNARFERVTPISQVRSPAIASLLRSDGTYSALDDYRGAEVIASVHQIPNTPWHLVFKMDEAEAYGSMNRAIAYGGLAFAAAGVAALLLIGVLFSSILRRMGRIASAATAISEGDLTSRVSDHTADELGRLAQSFDRMTDTLVTDMARRREVEQQLAHRASHDPLTGLPNRESFHDRLRLALLERPTAGSVAALF